jgi:hypothetical protein
MLFTDFPKDVQWRRVGLETKDLDKLKYANYPAWIVLSGGTRYVVDGARNVDTIDAGENINANIKALALVIRKGGVFPELIVAQGNGNDIIIVEGHTRASAYAIVKPPAPLELIVGTSPEMTKWHFY